jgi:hypothetical protein
MLAPQACVTVEISAQPALEQRAALERRCSEILGAKRCRIVLSTDEDPGSVCWRARVTTEGGSMPTEASVVLSDGTEPTHAPVRRDVTFRANDVVAERWATLGLVIAALVTVEEHSAAEVVPAATTGPAGGGFAPVIGGGDADLEARVETRSPVPVTGELGVAGVAGVGFLPSAALGVRALGVVAYGHLGVLARGTIFPAETRGSLGGHGAGDFDLASGGLGLCGVSARGRWGGRLCVGGDVARMRARGLGVTETNSRTAWWQALWLAPSAELRLARHLALTLELEAGVILRRPTFAINGTPSTFTAGPLGGTAALGLAVPF